MRRLALLLLIYQVLAGYDDCVIDNRSKERVWEHVLIRDLKKCADYFNPPQGNETNPVKVRVSFTMKSFKLNDEQEFSVSVFIYYRWNDERLIWDPEKYGGIDRVPIRSRNIWTPGKRLINGISDDYDESYIYCPCEVESSGAVLCIDFEVLLAKCGTDLTDWPFDAQYCKLVFGLQREKIEHLQLVVRSKAMFMLLAEYGSEWDIMDYQQEEDDNSEKQLTMTFRLERHSEGLSAIVVYPSLLLSLLTLSSLLIDARRNIRLLVLCISFIYHYDYLSEVYFDIPKHTKQSPRLLLYYRGSFILTSVMIALSIGLSAICRRKQACYNWVTSVNSFVYTKFVRFIIWPRWDSKVDDTNEGGFIKDWTQFANIFNSVLMVISVIVYVSLYFLFMPHPIPIYF